MIKVAVVSHNEKAEEAITQLLSPWLFDFSTVEKADVIFSYGPLIDTGKPTVIIPCETPKFYKWFKENKIHILENKGKKIKIPATENIKLTLKPQTKHFYFKFDQSKIVNNELLYTQVYDETLLLPVDLIKEYLLKMNQALYPKISSIYRFLTNLPIPYTLVPSSFRNLLFTSGKVDHNDSFLEHLDLDALRYLLLGAIQELTGKFPRKKTWNGRRYACLITHDVDTREGLRRALPLKRVEEEYDIPSAWFLPTERYELDTELILKLVNYGEVGAHGTKHDGKLIRLSKEEIVDRLNKAKQILATIIGQDVVGFRAPLLQHSKRIIQCLGEAEYSYDTSIPTWEPKHPSSMGPHGIGTIFPLEMDRTIEIPISVPQDHQMIHVLGMNPSQTIEKWIEIKETIKELGGLYTLLVHPDYEIAHRDSLCTYEELLNNIAADNQVWKTIPAEITKKSWV